MRFRIFLELLLWDQDVWLEVENELGGKSNSLLIPRRISANQTLRIFLLPPNKNLNLLIIRDAGVNGLLSNLKICCRIFYLLNIIQMVNASFFAQFILGESFNSRNRSTSNNTKLNHFSCKTMMKYLEEYSLIGIIDHYFADLPLKVWLITRHLYFFNSASWYLCSRLKL